MAEHRVKGNPGASRGRPPRWGAGAKALLLGCLCLASSFHPVTPAPAAPAVSLSAPVWEGVYDYRGTVSLRWFRVQGAVGYIVLRQVGEKDEFRELARVTNPTFDDPTIFPGKVVGYRVVPLDAGGKEGPVSQSRFVKLEGAGSVELAPPIWAPSMQMQDGVALSWSHPAANEVLAYNVYRRKGGRESYSLLTSSPDTTYLDRDVQPNGTYQYTVTALSRTLAESENSEALKITFVPPAAALRQDRAKKGALLEDLVSLTEEVKTYGPAAYGFLSPIDVDWWPDRKWLYVSDVGTGLITVINERHEVIHRLGGKGTAPWSFENLLGVCVDSRGFVYGTDAYRGEIVIFKPDGAFHKRIPLLPKVKEYFGREFTTRFPAFRFGLLDIRVTSDGTLVVVDNPNGWLYILDPQEHLVRIIGEKGEQEGQFHNPTFLAEDETGRLTVSDTLNSRLQVLTVLGAAERTLGAKGLGVGQILRPKGIVFDDRGLLFVADSFQNSIQVFDKQGAFVSVLADKEGKLLDLGMPNGLAWLGEDRLAICEKISRRVQVRKVALGSRTLFFSAPTDLSPLEKKR